MIIDDTEREEKRGKQQYSLLEICILLDMMQTIEKSQGIFN